jgi:hypothetical protein
MTPARTDEIANELRNLDEELKLSDAQREQMRMQLADRHASLQEFIRQNPNRKALIQKITSLRRSMRDEALRFLTPQQLTRWDSRLAKSSEFLGQSTVSSI